MFQNLIIAALLIDNIELVYLFLLIYIVFHALNPFQILFLALLVVHPHELILHSTKEIIIQKSKLMNIKIFITPQ